MARIHLIKNLHGLGTLECKTKKLTVYSYGGVEYAGRILCERCSGEQGRRSQCRLRRADVQQQRLLHGSRARLWRVQPGRVGDLHRRHSRLDRGDLGFWYKFYTGPKGAFQYGTQYSYVTRNTWSGMEASVGQRWSAAERAGCNGLHLVPLLLAVVKRPSPCPEGVGSFQGAGLKPAPFAVLVYCWEPLIVRLFLWAWELELEQKSSLTPAALDTL